MDMIVGDKIKELEQIKKTLPLELIKKRLLEEDSIILRDFKEALNKASGVALIAEIKKASPSLGDINTAVDILDQAKVYEQNGASALSVLTDVHFKGELSYLKQIKAITTIPILRKDFIFDPYQIYESKYYGADALLLIASIVTADRLRELVDLTHELGLECLLEVHSAEDLAKALAISTSVIGINARNLQTFEVDLENIVQLAKKIPPDKLLVAESGIQKAEDVKKLTQAGAKAILVGTTLMQARDLPAKIRELKLI